MAVQNSIVVINYNSKDALAKMLAALDLEHATTSEVIVVDSGSFDGSADFIRERYPTINLVQLPENRGWAAAANKGIAQAIAEIVVLCHADIVAPIHNLVELADKVREGAGRRIVAALPKLVDGDGAELPMVGRLPGIGSGAIGVFTPRFARRMETPSLDHVQDHQWASLACAAIDGGAVMKVGGFDERFFLYYADADLFARLHEKSYRISIRRDVSVVHTGDNPDESLPPHLARLMRKDQQKYFEKHRPGWEQGVLKLDSKLFGLLKKDAG